MILTRHELPIYSLSFCTCSRLILHTPHTLTNTEVRDLAYITLSIDSYRHTLIQVRSLYTLEESGSRIGVEAPAFLKVV